jgi:hypothetical protein
MRHTLHSHIIYLENSIQDVKNRLTQPNLTEEEIEDLHLQLTLAESALEHYRQAYTLELSLAGPEPPGQPAGGESNGGSQGPEKSNQEKKNDGLVAIGKGVRKRIIRTDRKRVAESPLTTGQQSRRAAS